jgi:hypothetical protein
MTVQHIPSRPLPLTSQRLPREPGETFAVYSARLVAQWLESLPPQPVQRAFANLARRNADD